MKIIYTTDLHGNFTKYQRLVDVAKEFNADIVVMGFIIYAVPAMMI